MITMEYDDISVGSLADAMEAAAIVVDRHDGETIYLKEGVSFPLWLNLERGKKRIVLHTYCEFKEYAATDRIPELIDELNGEYLMVQFSTKQVDGQLRLDGTYVMFTGFGIVVPQLVHATRRFAEIFRCGFSDHDPYGLFFD